MGHPRVRRQFLSTGSKNGVDWQGLHAFDVEGTPGYPINPGLTVITTLAVNLAYHKAFAYSFRIEAVR